MRCETCGKGTILTEKFPDPVVAREEFGVDKYEYCSKCGVWRPEGEDNFRNSDTF